MRTEVEIDWSNGYSQLGEDYFLRMMFPYATGHYVEVGVNEPRRNNSSFIFYEIGWSGLLVEPLTVWVVAGMKARPRDRFVAAAASDRDDELLTLNVFTNNGAPSSLRNDWITPEHQVRVTTKRLSTILRDHENIRANCDFCTIDVEGWERQVISGIDFATFRPSVFCIEAVRWNPFARLHREWEPMLIAAGYRLICSNIQNRFYGRSDDEQLWNQVQKWDLAE